GELGHHLRPGVRWHRRRRADPATLHRPAGGDPAQPDHDPAPAVRRHAAMGGDIDWMGPSLAVAGPLFGEFGVTLSAIVQNGSVLVESRPPSDYFTGDGVAPFLTEVEALLREIGPDIAPLGPMLAPVVTDAVARMPDLDIGALLDQALSTVEPDGVLRFRVTLK